MLCVHWLSFYSITEHKSMQLHFKMCAYFHVVERQSTHRDRGWGWGRYLSSAGSLLMSTTAMAGQAKARTLDIHPGLTKWVAGSQVLEQPCAASRDASAGSYNGSRGVGA